MIRKIISLLCLSTITLSTGEFLTAKDTPLVVVEQIKKQNNTIGLDEQLWASGAKKGDRYALIEAIDNSLKYLDTPKATAVYQNYPVSGINLDRVRRSLVRFRQLVKKSRTPKELQAAVKEEFVWYQSIGKDDKGKVHFTGYFEPVYKGSSQPTKYFPYPLYRKPSNFDSWGKPHPTRLQIEGKDGLLGKKSPLAGNEIAWLSSRLESFLIQIQGSARLILPNGKTMTVGFNGNTDYPYVSIGRELVKDKIFTAEEITLPLLIDYFRKNPQQLDKYLPRNNRVVFFRETNGAPPTGSIGVPVIGDRSIATDKSIMPPGALALIYTNIPLVDAVGNIQDSLVSRYVLDQDTGSAIKGPGRVDIFLGTGKIAGDRAGLVNATGSLYYLLLKK